CVDVADDDRRRVDAHATPKREAVAPPHLVPHRLQALLDGESGPERSASVVLARRIPEDCHDTVTEELVHRPTVLVHGVQHDVEGPLHDLADLLGMQTL